MSKHFIGTKEDSINKYFKDIKRHALVTPQEEVELAKRVKNGDSLAVDRLVTANLKFVISIAKKYQNQGIPLSDLINEGNEGLIKAVYKFDHTKGFRFISYAVWWIKQTIIQALNEYSRMVRLPVNQVNKISQQRKDIKKFEGVNLREPINGEVINEEIFETLAYPTCTSLNNHINEEKCEFSDLIIDDTFDSPDNVDDEDLIMRKKLVKLLAVLSPRERDIIESYYGLSREFEPMTLEAIGEKYNLTKERIRQIKTKSIRKLRHNIHDIMDTL